MRPLSWSRAASEIVTGALQDHDRAYVVGETTFGKALVQSVYRIDGNAGLALTTLAGLGLGLGFVRLGRVPFAVATWLFAWLVALGLAFFAGSFLVPETVISRRP